LICFIDIHPTIRFLKVAQTFVRFAFTGNTRVRFNWMQIIRNSFRSVLHPERMVARIRCMKREQNGSQKRVGATQTDGDQSVLSSSVDRLTPRASTPRLVVVTNELKPERAPSDEREQSETPPDTADEARQARDRQFAVWLSEAVAGNAQSFEAFYSASINYTYALVRRIVGGNLCEDVLADTYFQAWRDVSRFDATRGTAMTWLLTIARTRALDRLRGENLRHGGFGGAPEMDASLIEDDSVPGPDSLLETAETHSRLHAALSKLSANERWVLALAYFREFSHSEICAITGLALGTVKSLINRGQQKLRNLLSEEQSL
jgi:RNA polymerase sigma-70 factor, ECF subfamily